VKPPSARSRRPCRNRQQHAFKRDYILGKRRFPARRTTQARPDGGLDGGNVMDAILINERF